MANLNERIREQRLKKGYTLLQIAELIGVKEATVQRYESGEIRNIKHDTITKLSEILGCSPSYLMGWEDELEKYEAEEIPPSSSSFLKRLRETRKKRGLTIRQMADLLGVVASAYDQYETGDRKPDFIKIMDISKILGVSTDYLFFGNDVFANNTMPHLSELENKLVADFRKLNTPGKEKASEYVSDLTTMEKYIDADSDFKSKLG